MENQYIAKQDNTRVDKEPHLIPIKRRFTSKLSYLNPITEEEMDKRQKNRWLYENLHLWNWSAPFTNIRVTPQNANQVLQFNKDSAEGIATTGLIASGGLLPFLKESAKGLLLYLGLSSLGKKLDGDRGQAIGELASMVIPLKLNPTKLPKKFPKEFFDSKLANKTITKAEYKYALKYWDNLCKDNFNDGTVKVKANAILDKANGIDSKYLEMEKAKNAKKSKLLSFRKSSEVGDWNAKEWFLSGGLKNYTLEDVATFNSHIPEYVDLTNLLIKEGKLVKTKEGWKGNINGNLIRVSDPQEYVVSQSKAFKDAGLQYDGNSYYSGMSYNIYDDLKRNGGLNVYNYSSSTPGVAYHYSHLDKNGNIINGTTVQMVGKGDIYKLEGLRNSTSNKFLNTDLSDTPKPLENYIDLIFRNTDADIIDVFNYRDDASRINNIRTRIFGPKVRIKSIKGNNGNFDMTNNSPFAYVGDRLDTRQDAFLNS